MDDGTSSTLCGLVRMAGCCMVPLLLAVLLFVIVRSVAKSGSKQRPISQAAKGQSPVQDAGSVECRIGVSLGSLRPYLGLLVDSLKTMFDVRGFYKAKMLHTNSQEHLYRIGVYGETSGCVLSLERSELKFVVEYQFAVLDERSTLLRVTVERFSIKCPPDTVSSELSRYSKKVDAQRLNFVEDRLYHRIIEQVEKGIEVSSAAALISEFGPRVLRLLILGLNERTQDLVLETVGRIGPAAIDAIVVMIKDVFDPKKPRGTTSRYGYPREQFSKWFAKYPDTSVAALKGLLADKQQYDVIPEIDRFLKRLGNELSEADLEPLVQVLKSRRSERSQRSLVRSLVTMTESGSTVARDALVAALSAGANADVSTEFTISLVRIAKQGDTVVRDALIAALTGDVNRRTIEKLVQRGVHEFDEIDPHRVADYFLQLSRNYGERWGDGEKVLGWLVENRRDEKLVKLIASVLESNSGITEQYLATFAIACTGDSRFHGMLRTRLAGSDADMRQSVVLGLCRAPYTSDVLDILVPYIEAEQDPVMLCFAVRMIRRCDELISYLRRNRISSGLLERLFQVFEEYPLSFASFLGFLYTSPGVLMADQRALVYSNRYLVVESHTEDVYRTETAIDPETGKGVSWQEYEGERIFSTYLLQYLSS